MRENITALMIYSIPLSVLFKFICLLKVVEDAVFDKEFFFLRQTLLEKEQSSYVLFFVAFLRALEQILQMFSGPNLLRRTKTSKSLEELRREGLVPIDYKYRSLC